MNGLNGDEGARRMPWTQATSKAQSISSAYSSSLSPLGIWPPRLAGDAWQNSTFQELDSPGCGGAGLTPVPMSDVPKPTCPHDSRVPRLSPQQVRSGLAAWLGWLFDGLDMHLYTLVATAFVAQLLMTGESDPEVGKKASIIQVSSSAGHSAVGFSGVWQIF